MKAFKLSLILMASLALLLPLALALLLGAAGQTRLDGTDRDDGAAFGSVGAARLRLSGERPAASPASSVSPRLLSSQLARGLNRVAEGDGTPSLLSAFWGNVVTHDVARTATAEDEQMPIAVPRCDAFLDAACTGTASVPFARLADGANGVTAFLDASFLYGVDEAAAAEQRVGSGGRLRLADDGFLPDDGRGGFIVADARQLQMPPVTALRVALMHEHNRIADAVAAMDARLDDEQLFQTARVHIMHTVQRITVEEYLPLLTGTFLPRYTGLKADARPALVDEFAFAAMRYAHSSLTNLIHSTDAAGEPSAVGSLLLADVFNRPDVTRELGWLSFIYGQAYAREAKVDLVFPTGLRDRWDLFAIDVQRGRDARLPGINQLRTALGLEPYASLEALVGPDAAAVASQLREAYGDDELAVDDVDLVVAGLTERRGNANALLGETFAAVTMDQFERLRDGDRVWYELITPAYSDAVLRARNFAVPASLVELFANVVPDAPMPDQLMLATTPACAADVDAVAVADGERFTVQLADRYALTWQMTDAQSRINITIAVETRGWVGFGVGVSMRDVDLVTAYVDDATGACDLNDGYTENFDPKSDVSLGGTDDLTLIGCEQTATTTRVSFSRPLDSGDKFDNVIGRGNVDITFAWGERDEYLQHARSSRGMSRVNFETAAVSESASGSLLDDVLLFHGLLMTIGWGIVIPIGIMVARYAKNREWWLSGHKILQSIGTASTLPIGFSAVVAVSQHGLSLHASLGLTILTCTIIEALAGNALAIFFDSKFYSNRLRLTRRSHRILGRVLILASLAQVTIGISLATEGNTLTYVFIGWICLLAIVCGVMEVYRSRPHLFSSAARASAVAQAAAGLDKMKKRDFDALIASGRQLLVMDGYVLDVGTWATYHPGGRHIILGQAGRDVSHVVRGRGGPSHSALAMVQMRRLRIATIADTAMLASDAVDPDALANAAESTTAARVQQRIRCGEHLLLYGEKVIDVKSFLRAHPGGPDVLTAHLGRDVRRVFAGDGGSGHAHSAFAEKILASLVVATLGDYEDDEDASGPTRALPALVSKRSGEMTLDDIVDSEHDFAFKPCTIRSTEVISTEDDERHVRRIVLEFDAASPLAGTQPGQHVMLRRPSPASSTDDMMAVMRTYTPVTISPTSVECIVRIFPDGAMTSYLDTLHAGAPVDVCGPQGDPVYVPNGLGRVVFIAAGTGLNPFLAFLEARTTLPAASITLICANRSEPLMRTRLADLAAKFKGLRIVHILSRPPPSWTGLKGRLTGDVLVDLVPRPPKAVTVSSAPSRWRSVLATAVTADYSIHICGPRPFEQSMRAALHELGHAKTNIHVVFA